MYGNSIITSHSCNTLGYTSGLCGFNGFMNTIRTPNVRRNNYGGRSNTNVIQIKYENIDKEFVREESIANTKVWK